MPQKGFENVFCNIEMNVRLKTSLVRISTEVLFVLLLVTFYFYFMYFLLVLSSTKVSAMESGIIVMVVSFNKSDYSNVEGLLKLLQIW